MILDAARVVIKEVGLDRFTFRDVASRCVVNTSPSTVKKYYKNREALLAALFTRRD